MKKILLLFIAASSLSVFAGCACDSDRHVSTSTSESATVDSKDMHPVQQQNH